MKKIFLISLLALFTNVLISAEIKDHTGFIVRAMDAQFQIISPLKFKEKMEVVIENKTNIRMIGRIMINRSRSVEYVSIEPQEYKKYQIELKKNDILHYLPLTPAFQEIELIVGNKSYEIPPKH